MNLKKILLIIFLLAICFVIYGSIFVSSKNRENGKSQIATPVLISPAVLSVPTAKKTEALIVSVGDIFLHQSNLDSAFDSNTQTYDFNDAFSPVAKYFHEADFSTASFGGVINDKGPYSGYPSFRSPAELAKTLKDLGVGIVFRTNHTMDFGIKGLETTDRILKENNISQVAAAVTEEESKNIFIYQKDNLKIAFLGYIYGMNGIPIPETWMVNLIDLKKIESDIKKAKEKADFVIVQFHFGTEYYRYPDKFQIEVVQKTADLGADMIIGSHPHVILPAEMLTSVDGRKVFVAYALGNFFCGQRQKYTDEGIILRYVIEKTESGTKLKEVKYIPTWVAKYLENGKYKFRILPSNEYLKLYPEGKANFLSAENYKHLQETYQETVMHIDNPDIGFTEYEPIIEN